MILEIRILIILFPLLTTMSLNLIGDLDDEYKDIPVGKSFTGICVNCKTSDEVRLIKDERGGKKGPFDRLCAYEAIFGNIPPFITQPDTTPEYLYRVISKEEIPHNFDAKQFFHRIGIVLLTLIVGSTWLTLYALQISQSRADTFGLIVTLVWTFMFMFGFFSFFIRFDEEDKLGRYQSFLNLKKLLNRSGLYDELSWTEYRKNIFRILIATTFYGPFIVFGIIFLLVLPFMLLTFFYIPLLLLLPLLLINILISIPTYLFSGSNQNLNSSLNFLFGGLMNDTSNGTNYLEKFELIWNGKATKQSHTLRSKQIRLGIVIFRIFVSIALTPLFVGIMKGNSSYVNYFSQLYLDRSINVNFFSQYYIIEYASRFGISPILVLAVTFVIGVFLVTTFYQGMIFLFIPSAKYRRPPDDVQHRILQRYFDPSMDEVEIKLKRREASNKLKNLLSFSNPDQWKIQCLICRKDIREENQNLTQCDICKRVFHEDHIMAYLEERKRNNQSPDCPACDSNFDFHLSKFSIAT